MKINCRYMILLVFLTYFGVGGSATADAQSPPDEPPEKPSAVATIELQGPAPKPGREYAMKFVKPAPGIDYEIMRVLPDPTVDYKIGIVGPEGPSGVFSPHRMPLSRKTPDTAGPAGPPRIQGRH